MQNIASNDMVCLLCEESRIPDGETSNGRFFCSTCGKEWILEKRKKKRISSFFRTADDSALLNEFITIFDSGLKAEEIYTRLLSIFNARLEVEQSAIILKNDLSKSYELVRYYTSEKKMQRKAQKLRYAYEEPDNIYSTCIEKRDVVFHSVHKGNRYDELYRRITGTQYSIILPVFSNGEALGLVSLDFKDIGQAKKILQHTHLVTPILHQFGIALQNAISYAKANKRYIDYVNLNSACLLLNKLYLNNSTEIIKMTLLSISGFINTRINILLEYDRDAKLITAHRLQRTLESLDLDKLEITNSLESFEKLFRNEDARLLHIKDNPCLFSFGYKRAEVLVLPPFIIDGKEFVFLMGWNTRRHFSEDEIALLRDYYNQVKITIENSFLTQKMAIKERLEKEVQIASDIQLNLLPQFMPENNHYEFAGFMKPAREIGGDYYDIIVSPDKKDIIVAIGDVSGKGIPAGMVMATARTVIHSIVRKEASTWEIIKAVNTFLHYNYKNSVILRFMSLIIFHLQYETSEIVFSGAGHGNIAVYRYKEDQVELVSTGGIILGIESDISSFFNESFVKLGEGDILLMYTDGATEAMNRRGELFEEYRLLDAFKKWKHLGIKAMLEHINKEILQFMGNSEQQDDITLVAIRKKIDTSS
ncbi:MAG: serine/threonine-protein phosphatase [Leptospiraceae bacterium]|nr:serine/threonine-protein phosphatase [Leptospiraceae bacterium]